MDDADGMIVIYTTFPSEEDARRTGEKLVGERLAACVNMFPSMTSIYRWQGKIESGPETAMIVKTRKSLRDAAISTISTEHPYSVPALLVFDPLYVERNYLDWLLEETKKVAVLQR